MRIFLQDIGLGLAELEACSLDTTAPPTFIDCYGRTMLTEQIGDIPLLAQGIILRKLLSCRGDGDFGSQSLTLDTVRRLTMKEVFKG